MIRKIENIEQFNRFFGQPTYHPQVSVCNLADADASYGFWHVLCGVDGGGFWRVAFT